MNKEDAIYRILIGHKKNEILLFRAISMDPEEGIIKWNKTEIVKYLIISLTCAISNHKANKTKTHPIATKNKVMFARGQWVEEMAEIEEYE